MPRAREKTLGHRENVPHFPLGCSLAGVLVKLRAEHVGNPSFPVLCTCLSRACCVPGSEDSG